MQSSLQTSPTSKERQTGKNELFGCWLIVLFYCLLALLPRFAETANNGADVGQDSGPESMDIIAARGFRGELYLTKSLDGYTISLYHLINPLADQRRLNKYPVLIFHGLGGDAAQMLSYSKSARPRRPLPGSHQVQYDPNGDESLPFLLANNNYDVYLVDARGTNLNNHESKLDMNFYESQKFWNFSIDEQALNDLPVIIDYILDLAGTDKLHYLGYSESTSFWLALMSTRPEYQAKMASFTGFAPVAYASYIRGVSNLIFLPVFLTPDTFTGSYAPQPLIDSAGVAIRMACSNGVIASTICTPLVRTVTGVGSSDAAATSFYTTSLKPTSIKALRHFLQIILKRRFAKYDYGPEGNLRQYGQLEPPLYELSRIKVPRMILARGSADFVSTPEDQERLISELGIKLYRDIVLPHYNHLDFVLSKSILRDLNLPLVKTLNGINRQLLGDSPEALLRDATRVIRRHKPARITRTNNSRQLNITGHFYGNLLRGLQSAQPNFNVLSLLPQPIAQRGNQFIKDIGGRLDNLNDRFTYAAHRATGNS